MTILVLVYLAPFGFSYRTPLALNLVAFKVLMAYFGQLCHCMSHMPTHKRPQWVKHLQRMNLMISPKNHLLHHTNYDSNFCIGSGICNPVIKFLQTNLGENKWMWLTAFVITLLMDIPVMNYLLCKFLWFQ